MGSTVSIEVPAEFRRWVSGLASLDPAVDDTRAWNQAAEFMFSETQRRVHVLTGDLKRSGEIVDAIVEGQQVAVEIVYYAAVGWSQTREIDYGVYEIARGGSHDFLTPSVEAAKSVFQESMLDMALAMVNRKVRSG